VILYEFPLNEGIRTMLRLEHLFDRLGQMVSRDTAVDHHVALVTMFEIVDVASRADLKSDLLKELDRQRHQLLAYRSRPEVEHGKLNELIQRVDQAWQGLNALPGKAGAELTGHDWLMSIRSRISIPGGTCEFDHPSYHAWQQRSAGQRRSDLMNWMGSLMPFAQAISALLTLMRDSAVPNMVMATGGQYQQSLPPGRSFQLMRVRMEVADDVVPEISAHRLMASIRLMQQDEHFRLRPMSQDVPIELTLCC
jgi:cell division protein ZapD